MHGYNSPYSKSTQSLQRKHQIEMEIKIIDLDQGQRHNNKLADLHRLILGSL